MQQQPKLPAYSFRKLVSALWIFVRPYKWGFFASSVLRTLSETAWLYPAFALASIASFFADYSTGESLDPFWAIMVKLALANLAYFGFAYIASNIGFRLAKRAAVDSELHAIKHILSLDIDWHERENTGNKVKRIDRGAEGVNQILRMWYSSAIEISVALIGVFFVMSRFDRTIALVTIVFFVAYFGLSFFFTRKAVLVQRQENLKDEELSGITFEAVNNVRSAKVMSMVAPLTKIVSKACGEMLSLAHKRIFWYQTSGAIKSITAQSFRLLMLCYIGYGIMHGRYDVGFIVLFYSYFSTVNNAVSKLSDTAQDFAVRRQAVGRMMELLEEKPNTDIEAGKVPFPDNWKKIELKDVSFSYGDKSALDRISLTISRGEKIGVIGLSGSGKSTLFKLLLKERENYTGEILVDGIPLRSISKLDYFKHAAVVLQETEVFNLPLKRNITISNDDRTSDEALLHKALEVAHVTEFAQKLPLGIETLIGEKGVKLSGGEKQRVGMARAVFKDPELLLLDEATSHLDVESEEKIQDSLHQFFKTVTAVVIAHRLTTIKEMDKILVIEGGKILEQGSFAELYGKKGRFFELWEKQKL